MLWSKLLAMLAHELHYTESSKDPTRKSRKEGGRK